MSYRKRSEIEQLALEAITRRVFPGCVVGVLSRGEATILPFGRLTYEETSPLVTPETVYDLASVTKSIPVNCLVMHLIEQGRLSLDEKAAAYLPELRMWHRDEILIRHLMTYTVVYDLPQGLSAYAREGSAKLLETLFAGELKAPPGELYHYTNQPAILLGLIIERIYGRRLDEIAEEVFFSPLGMDSTTFWPERLGERAIAPSEVDWRGTVRGQVHDEAAWTLRRAGMVAGNAGVFSTAGDLLTFARMLLAEGHYEGRRYFMPETVRAMHENQIGYLGDCTGLGWEMGQERFMGTEISPDGFGKTGFTGTFILIDPASERALVLLSNRTYPNRPGSRDAINEVRRRLADTVFSG